jgi:hypothetical protein
VSQLLTPGERPDPWSIIGDLLKRVAKLEAVPASGGGIPGTEIWGALYNDANIIEGTGFTATWDNNGGAPTNLNYYTIYFNTPFTNPPVVEFTANNNNPETTDGAYGVSLKTRTAAYIVAITTPFDGSPGTGGGFDFVATEPGV